MYHVFRYGLIAAIATISFAVTATAQEKSVEGKLEPHPLATSINFSQDLGLSFPSVTQIGARIEAARAAADPVGLASVAKELAALEKVSGKAAALTSAELAHEAVFLAKRRNHSVELKAVAQILGDLAGEDLTILAEKAHKMEHAAKEAKENGEKSRGITQRLHVDNHSQFYLAIYVDANYIGTVAPFGDLYYWVGQGVYETTYLDARTGTGVGVHKEIGWATGDFVWQIYP